MCILVVCDKVVKSAFLPPRVTTDHQRTISMCRGRRCSAACLPGSATRRLCIFFAYRWLPLTMLHVCACLCSLAVPSIVFHRVTTACDQGIRALHDTTPGSAAPAPSQMPAPPGQKMTTMETNIPETWSLGRSSCGSRRSGRRWPDSTLARHKPCPNSSSNAQPNHDQVALTVPETAKPGQTLEFQVPASIVSGGRSHDPDPNICLTPTLTGPWELLRTLTLSAYSHPSLGKSPSPKVTHLPRFASSSTQPPPAEDVPTSAPAPVCRRRIEMAGRQRWRSSSRPTGRTVSSWRRHSRAANASLLLPDRKQARHAPVQPNLAPALPQP